MTEESSLGFDKSLISNVSELEEKEQRYKASLLEIQDQLQSPDIARDQTKLQTVSINYKEAKDKHDTISELIRYINQYIESEDLLSSESDPEMLDLINADIAQLQEHINNTHAALMKLEEEVDPLDKGNAIIEIRAGAGGEESALFAQEMYRAYSKYVEKIGLKVEVASTSYANVGGFKEVIFFVNGPYAYKNFKYENGVHRVQRVPATESSGRIHTSTISVVVLPESDEVKIEIKDEDIRIDVYRAGGPGGQSVNTTDSAVRIVHLPTGIIVTCQDEKSQLKNKAKALKILQAKLYDLEKQRQEAELGKLRQSAIKSGDRSAKIRTYNFPQSRVTDHRIKESWHNLPEIMEGEFSHIMAALSKADQVERQAEKEAQRQSDAEAKS